MYSITILFRKVGWLSEKVERAAAKHIDSCRHPGEITQYLHDVTNFLATRGADILLTKYLLESTKELQDDTQN